MFLMLGPTLNINGRTEDLDHLSVKPYQFNSLNSYVNLNWRNILVLEEVNCGGRIRTAWVQSKKMTVA